MIIKIFKQLNTQSPHVGERELCEFFDEIDRKDKEIAEKKAKVKEDYELGARITKHRFTI